MELGWMAAVGSILNVRLSDPLDTSGCLRLPSLLDASKMYLERLH